MTSAGDRGPRRSLRDRASESRNRDHDARRAGVAERVFLIGLDARHTGSRDGGPDDDNGDRRSSKLTSAVRAARNAARAVTENAKLSRTPEFSAEESLAELHELAVSAG